MNESHAKKLSFVLKHAKFSTWLIFVQKKISDEKSKYR